MSELKESLYGPLVTRRLRQSIDRPVSFGLKSGSEPEKEPRLISRPHRDPVGARLQRTASRRGLKYSIPSRTGCESLQRCIHTGQEQFRRCSRIRAAALRTCKKILGTRL